MLRSVWYCHLKRCVLHSSRADSEVNVFSRAPPPFVLLLVQCTVVFRGHIRTFRQHSLNAHWAEHSFRMWWLFLRCARCRPRDHYKTHYMHAPTLERIAIAKPTTHICLHASHIHHICTFSCGLPNVYWKVNRNCVAIINPSIATQTINNKAPSGNNAAPPTKRIKRIWMMALPKGTILNTTHSSTPSSRI